MKKTFDRRRFLSDGCMTSAALAVGRIASSAVGVQSSTAERPEELSKILHSRLESSDPQLWTLASEVFRRCILGRLELPRAPLSNTWVQPGGSYEAQWLWDTMFVTDLLSILPGQKETIRGIFQNYWDFQERWSKTHPDYAQGMIACYIAPFDGKGRDGRKWLEHPAFSQAPLLAWGMERVFHRSHDLELVRAGLKPLEQFHLWYWRERDVLNQGLISVGSYSGIVQDARYETYDGEVDLDDLQLTPHPIRQDGKAWYGDICIPANTAYLLQSEKSLARLAGVAGDRQVQLDSVARFERGAEAMRRCMWDEPNGCFMAVRRETLEKVSTPTVGGLVPLFAGVPTKSQAARMAEKLVTSDWSTTIPVPTVSRSNKAFSSSAFWRGDTWPVPTFQICSGLALYGHNLLAAKLADRLLGNSLKHGISERYDSMTGEGLGVPYLGMSGTLLTLALDGLTDRYRMSVLGATR